MLPGDMAIGGSGAGPRGGPLLLLRPREDPGGHGGLARESKDPADYPWPDLAVEIDISYPEADRGSIYSALRVAEVGGWSRGRRSSSISSSPTAPMPRPRLVGSSLPPRRGHRLAIRRGRRPVRRLVPPAEPMGDGIGWPGGAGGRGQRALTAAHGVARPAGRRWPAVRTGSGGRVDEGLVRGDRGEDGSGKDHGDERRGRRGEDGHSGIPARVRRRRRYNRAGHPGRGSRRG